MQIPAFLRLAPSPLPASEARLAVFSRLCARPTLIVLRAYLERLPAHNVGIIVSGNCCYCCSNEELKPAIVAGRECRDHAGAAIYSSTRP